MIQGTRWSVARQTQDRKRSHERPGPDTSQVFVCDFGKSPVQLAFCFRPYGSISRAHRDARVDIRTLEQAKKSKRQIQPTRLTGSPGCLSGSNLKTDQRRTGCILRTITPKLIRRLGLQDAGLGLRCPLRATAMSVLRFGQILPRTITIPAEGNPEDALCL